MQNWSQWQLSAGAVATPMPQPPVGYATPGADPMTTMQAYMQYYSQPAPSGYTAEQWQAAQQQNWSQWQQWQQQYQQWQAQYGEKYQETMKHMSAQNMSLATQVSQLPIVQPPPPLPKEEAKPPLPPTTMNTYQFTSMPPPHQNNLPLFPVKQNANATAPISVQNCPQNNPPLPPTQPPLPPESSNNGKESTLTTGKRGSSSVSESNSAKKLKVEDDELTEAEKTFDAQFKQWEEQFNKWKEQNANHPDKTQYKQYEAKWTSWREKLIERREQMRKKREQQKQAAAKAEVDKNKSLPGDDKIMNILSSTENQGLINNLLGIGKTLGLTTKQNANVPPPPPPPPPPATETATSTVQTSTMATTSQGTSSQSSTSSQLPASVNAMPSNAVSSSPWNSQQWAQQYNAGANVPPGISNFQSVSGGVPPPPFGAPPAQMPPPNFAQPPPNYSSVPNFSQPPPGFAGNDRQNPPVPPNMQGRPPSSYGPNSASGPDGTTHAPNERLGQAAPMNNFDSINHPNNFGGSNESNRQKDGPPASDRFGRDAITEQQQQQQGNQFRSNDVYGQRNENYKFHDERLPPENDQFRREDRNYQEHGNNQFGQQKLNFNNDRFNSGNDRSGGPGNNRFSSNDRFGPGNDRFNLGNDRSGLANDRFGSGDSRFANERFGPSTERSGQQGGEQPAAGDRFGGNDRFGPNNEPPFGPASDRFSRNNMDRFDQKDIGDRRDSFPNASRGFGRSNHQFEPSDKLAPELKKLMEKRRAAMDVFRPSYLDSDKSSNVGSLSESFKKITGDSPFMKNSGINNNFGPRGPGPGPGSGPGPGPGPGSGPGNFRMPMDFKPQGNPDFGPRCLAGYARNASFDTRDGMPFRGPSPQQAQDMNVQPRLEIANVGAVADIVKDSKELIGGEDQHPLVNPPVDGRNVDGARKDDCNNSSYSVQSGIPLLEKTPWTDNQFPEGRPQKEPSTVTDGDDSSIGFVASEQSTQNVIPEMGKVKQDLSTKDNDTKKAEVLPFMGENDPKPEDLNMEPPPEFPNLGPVTTTDAVKVSTAEPLRRIDEMHDEKQPTSSQAFLNNPECSASRDHFDPALGSARGMQFRPTTPFFSPRGPGDNRFPMFEPRGSMPFNPVGPNSYSLGPRGPNDGQFGPRGPPNVGQFDRRGSNDGQFDPRGPNDAQFRPRGPSDGQFGARGPNDGPFGQRGPTDGPFGQRGPNDGSFGPRAAIDGPFGQRSGPNGGQFGARGSNIGQFGPKYDGQFGQRRGNEGQFRGPNDGHFGTQGPSSRSFGPGRPTNDAPFDINRGPNNMQFATSRGPNDGQLKFSGPGGDTLFGSRRNEASYQRSPSGSKAANEGQFPNRFNEKSFDTPTDGTLLAQAGSEPFFGPRGGPASGPSDTFATRERQFDGRGVNNTIAPKNRENSEVISDVRGNNNGGGAFECKDQMQMDHQSMQQVKFDSNDVQGSGWKQQQSYAKANLGDTDQRAVQEFRYNEKPILAKSEPFNQCSMNNNNVERRSPLDATKPNNLGDTRADKTMNELGAIVESPAGSEYSRFNSANMYAKRSMDSSRQSRVVRCAPVKEFCIEKQFNYNHGGAAAAPTDKKFLEHVPAKVIEYAHTSRTSIQDHLTPVQCFDYGHGNLKPLIPDREMQPKKDFRHWEESEQNLKEYTEKIRRYEHYSGQPDNRRTGGGGDYGRRRNSEEEYTDERKPGREYREKENYKAKGRDERTFDRSLNKDEGSRYDKKANKERTRERNEQIQKEKNKENNKDEDRSKGNINWQENTNKNIVEIKPPDTTSVTDVQHNVVESAASKTLELAKTPNCTMVDDLLCAPGRQNRPPKIAIILRGPPGSGKSFVAKLIKDKEVEQGGSAPRILSLDDYFLVEKEVESTDDNGKKVTVKEMIYEYEEAMEQSYVASLVKAFKKNITDGFFNFIILDCINEKISDYEEMWSFAKTKGFKVYVCEMEMDLQICLKRNIHNRTEDEINRIIDYFEPTPSYHQKLDVNSMLQEQAIEEVHMEDSEETTTQEKVVSQQNEDSQDSQEDAQEDGVGVSKWERMEAEDKLDRLDGLAKKKNEGKVQTMKDFLQVPDYYNMEDTSGKKRVRWADLEERKEQEKMRAVGFVVGHTNWDRMMDPTKGGSALTRTKFFSLS